jgi:hypothetical protein
VKLSRVLQLLGWKGLLPSVAALLVFNLVNCGASTTRQVLASESASAGLASIPSGGGGPLSPAAPEVVTTTLYLPTVIRNWPPPNVFGINVSPLAPDVGLGFVLSTTTQWVRGPFVPWQQVEPAPGTRNWAAAASVERELLTAAQNNLSVILAVSQTPAWAQKVAGSSCGPVAANQLAAFAAFMHDMVARYSAPPYNVRYFELWNEPDIDHKLVPADSPFGCWGDDADPYYGGGYYAQMLAQVVPQMRSAGPGIRVTVGGLLLDCDPVHPPSGKNCQSSKFLEGILRGGGGPFFDGISFHAYDYYSGALGRYANPNWNSAWNSDGPVTRAKLKFLKSVLAGYGITGKFFQNTELALLCDANCGPAFDQTKADYLAEVYAAAVADGLTANVWYSLSGWRNSGLLDSRNQPVPAFAAYRFSSQELHDAFYKRDVTDFPGLSGFEFEHGGGRVWVLWSADGGSHLANLPSMPAAVDAVDGTPISPTTSLAVGIEPRYVEWNP